MIPNRLLNLVRYTSITTVGKIRSPEFIECSSSASPDVTSFRVIPNFASHEEENNALKEISQTLRRRKYQYDHWDGAIEGYRETEKTQWLDVNEPLIERLRGMVSSFFESKRQELMEEVHVLDLAEDGEIRPHIDSVKFCGDVIAGLSLLSSSVMIMQHQTDPQKWIQALLPRYSLYIMNGAVRYNYTHAIPKGKSSKFRGEEITREQRISIICRTKPENL